MSGTSQFSGMTSSSKFHVIIITGFRVMTIFVYKGLTRNLEFCPTSGDWGELGISYSTRLSLMKCYWMLQNFRVTALTVSALVSENQQGRKIPPSCTPLHYVFYSEMVCFSMINYNLLVALLYSCWINWRMKTKVF